MFSLCLTQRTVSMELRKIVSGNYAILQKCVDPSIELLGYLYTVDYLKVRVSSIKQHARVEEKIDALLTALQEVPDDIQESVTGAFAAALRSCDQEHVANIFRRESDQVPMSGEHLNILKEQTAELCKFLDPENGVLVRLFSSKVISQAEKSRIRSKEGFSSMAEELIDIILRKSDDAFQLLVDALHETGQSHVAYILTGQGDSKPLSEYCSTILMKKRTGVVNSIWTPELVTPLVSYGVFTYCDQERVEGRDTSGQKSEMMVNLMARKSQTDFDGFICTLMKHSHEHVVEELMGAEVAAKIKASFSAEVQESEKEVLLRRVREIMQEALTNDNDETKVKRLGQMLEMNGISVSEMAVGSIIVKFKCSDRAALESLEGLYRAKRLDQLFTEAFCPDLEGEGLESLGVVISDDEFERHKALELMSSKHRKVLLKSEEWMRGKITVDDDLLNKLSLSKRRKEAIEAAAKRDQRDHPDQQVNAVIYSFSRGSTRSRVKLFAVDYGYGLVRVRIIYPHSMQ